MGPLDELEAEARKLASEACAMEETEPECVWLAGKVAAFARAHAARETELLNRASVLLAEGPGQGPAYSERVEQWFRDLFRAPRASPASCSTCGATSRTDPRGTFCSNAYHAPRASPAAEEPKATDAVRAEHAAFMAREFPSSVRPAPASPPSSAEEKPRFSARRESFHAVGEFPSASSRPGAAPQAPGGVPRPAGDTPLPAATDTNRPVAGVTAPSEPRQTMRTEAADSAPGTSPAPSLPPAERAALQERALLVAFDVLHRRGFDVARKSDAEPILAFLASESAPLREEVEGLRAEVARLSQAAEDHSCMWDVGFDEGWAKRDARAQSERAALSSRPSAPSPSGAPGAREETEALRLLTEARDYVWSGGASLALYDSIDKFLRRSAPHVDAPKEGT